MIQRIQSIWLLLSALCSGLIFLVPLGNSESGQKFFVHGWQTQATEDGNTGVLWMLVLACALLPLPVIFQFRKRARQIKMIWTIVVLNLAMAALLLFAIFETDQAQPGAGFLLIPASAVFLILAIVAISKDEKLIRSADRLR